MDVELRRIRLPLTVPFRTARGIQHDRDVLLVSIDQGDTIGWGECVAMSAPTYSPEYTAGAHAVMRDVLLPMLAGSDPTSQSVGPLLTSVRGNRMAKAAIEMALLDGELRAQGRSLASHLGAVRDTIPVGVAVGIDRNLDRLVDTVRRHLEHGYRRVKLKIAPGWDIEPVAAIREHLGHEPILQVDGNGAYAPTDARHLAGLDAFDLAMIEQPFEDLLPHVALARAITTPVCLDESITSVAAAHLALDVEACSIMNIKPGRVGGYLEARRIHDLCLGSSVPVWCGGMLETGLGRAANLALAGLPGFTLPSDISETSRYFDSDITREFTLDDDGTIRVPDEPGIGVTPDGERLDDVTTSIEHVRI